MVFRIRGIAFKVLSSGEYGENDVRMQDETVETVQDTSHLAIYLQRRNSISVILIWS